MQHNFYIIVHHVIFVYFLHIIANNIKKFSRNILKIYFTFILHSRANCDIIMFLQNFKFDLC